MAADPVSMTIMIVKIGVKLNKSSTTVAKVNQTIECLRAYDTDGNLELDESEIKRALETLKRAIRTSRDKKVSAQLAELRCLLIFIGASQSLWEKDPKHYDAKFSKSLPTLFGFISTANWDSNPKIAKLEKIVCTFYKAQGSETMRQKIQEAMQDEANGDLQEQLFGTTFENITEEILSEAFGDVAADFLMAFI
mmetsp:Transcript_37450/g.48452  ORF Transcript_37450/g.48452 Transcript_37450/m.48452 type:complete len:194 (+) Transcript_37450:48-629(+)